MPRGGKREGAGRKPGSLNMTTVKRLEAIRKEAEKGILPIEVLMSTMRKLWEEGDTVQACKLAADAAPYMHPRLSAVDMDLVGDLTIEIVQFGEPKSDPAKPDHPAE